MTSGPEFANSRNDTSPVFLDIGTCVEDGSKHGDLLHLVIPSDSIATATGEFFVKKKVSLKNEDPFDRKKNPKPSTITAMNETDSQRWTFSRRVGSEDDALFCSSF